MNLTKFAKLISLSLAIQLGSSRFIASAADATTPAPATAPSMETMSADQVSAIEAELATLLQRRLDATGPELAVLDYQIDMRLVQRWLLSRASEPKTPIEMQACIALRVANLKAIGDLIAQRIQGSNKALAATQLDGLAKLHQLTFKLQTVKSIGAMDEVCKLLAMDLVLASNATPAEVKNLPMMRPQPLPETSTRPATAPRTLAQLVARAKEVSVGPALKRQLIALAGVAEAASVDPKAQDDAPSLYETLATAIDLSDGIALNTGIDAAGRPKVELQLTEGVALYTDSRTRSAGQQRIGALGQYHKTVERIQRLHIPAALNQKLSAAFIWVNNNPDSSGPVLDSIEKYLQLCTRYDARKEPPAGLTLNLKKTLDVLHKQFASQRNSFLEDAGGMGAAGVFATGPANLKSHVELMTDLVDNIDSVEKLPHAVQVLVAFRLRPAGALEKRTTTACNDLGLPSTLGSRDASVRLIKDVEHLAFLADTTAGPPPGISPETVKAYTHDRMSAVSLRRVALVTELASQLAAGRDMDATDLSKAQTLHDLLDSLRLANDVEVGLNKADLLGRWADWSISPAQLKAMVSPYRDATASAFEGFVDDNATPIFRWADVRTRFLPLLILTKEVGLYADQCTDFPTGLSGEFAKLLTPMDNQPFSTERFASLAVGVWQTSAAQGDQKATDMVFDAMLARLRKELRLD